MDHTNHHSTSYSSESALTFGEKVQDAFSQYGFMPHGHCYLWKPLLVSIHVISDALIGIAYLAISLTLYLLVRKINLPFTRVVWAFGIFIAACGMTHIMEIWNLWNADYWWSAWVKVVTAIASVATGIYLFRLRHKIVDVAVAAKLSEQRRLELEALTVDLETRVQERTRQLSQAVLIRDQFLSLAAHELKTPLTTLSLQSQMHERKIKGDEIVEAYDIQKFIEIVSRQTLRLSRVVDDMLDVSRIEVGKLDLNLETANLGNVVKNTVESLTFEFEKKHNEIEMDLKPVADSQFDTFRIEQVLNNILINAMKYASGSKIEIRLDDVVDGIHLTIKDYGQGISSENLEKIFQRFERVAEENEPSGLGLGLFISQQIILAHHGKIWAESELNQGTTFHIILPKN